jgi:two-component system chemotaxis response regulator CheY
MKRVLVVDDDLGIRRLARLALASAGFEVALASDGREALSYLSTDVADVIVLDLNMPVMDGYTFVHNLDDVRHRPHILILSGERAEKAQRELGADASLQKPFLPEDLIAKVAELAGPTPAAG